MDEQAEQNDDSLGFEIISWDVPEYHKHTRGKWWYALFALIGIALLAYAVLSGNFLFAVLILVAGFVMILNDARHPEPVRITLTTEGLLIGNRFYDYDEIHHFSIVYKPAYDIKRLYFEFKSILKPRLSIALLDINPLFLREQLIKYLTEDLERTDEPTSELISRLFKL